MRELRVMLVDDHNEFRAVLKGFLEAQDFVGVVAEAGDGVEAIETARRVCPDLILMDISMPRMDGFGATQEIKRVQPEIAIVFVSFYDEPRYEKLAREIGAEGFISKASLAKGLPGVLVTMRERALQTATALSRKGGVSEVPPGNQLRQGERSR